MTPRSASVLEPLTPLTPSPDASSVSSDASFIMSSTSTPAFPGHATLTTYVEISFSLLPGESIQDASMHCQLWQKSAQVSDKAQKLSGLRG